MRKLKVYAVFLGIGAVLGIALAETWRRRVLHDSYANYLPPPLPHDESAPAPEPASAGRVRGAASRVWRPVAASARVDVIRVRRIRAHAPRPTADGPAGSAADRPDASVPPVDEQP
jgi:hypothetical protein